MTILDEIFAHKKAEVAAQIETIPFSQMRTEAEAMKESPRGFRNALATALQPVALIAEVKKASPSEGLIRPNFDPRTLARSYAHAGAHCLSVLTDEKYFQGSPGFLSVAKAGCDLPVLRKDFIYDSYQVYQSRVWGADAILLIVAGLEPSHLADLYGIARSLCLDVLVEVHDEVEVDIANSLGADLIGVNNRDLRTFKTDLAVSERLIPRLDKAAVAVSESSINAYADVRRVQAAGARAVLVGTTFAREVNVEDKVRQVMNW